MAERSLEAISESVTRQKVAGLPPLQLWNPELSGDIDIVIKADGRWIHEGRPIQRQALVNLFATVLRREADGEYYLVTPVEKWRLQVECLPLLVTDFDILNEAGEEQKLEVEINTGRRVVVGESCTLFLPEQCPGIPGVMLEHGIAALFGRAAWLRLAENLESRGAESGIHSCGKFYILG